MDISSFNITGTYKLKMEYTDSKTGLPVKVECMVGTPHEAQEKVAAIMNGGHLDPVETVLYVWEEHGKEWLICQEKTYYPSDDDGIRQFFLIRDGGHEHRFKHSSVEEIVIHLPSGIRFYVNDRQTAYSEELKTSPEVLFYKFKYTSEFGKVYRFTIFCNLMGKGYSSEKLSEIQETILKPGAKWYCQHFQEAYRSYRGEDSMTIWLERLKNKYKDM